MVQKRVKCYSKTNKLWVTPAIINSIHRKNSLYKRYLKTKSLAIEEKCKKIQNKLTGIIRLLKKNYYKNKFNLTKDSISNTWKVIKNNN